MESTISAENFWDRIAARYARTPIADEQTYQRKLAETQEYLRPDSRVLEFGCGTGSTAVHHAAQVAHIDAIDISRNMLDIGHQKAHEAALSNIHFTQADLVDFAALGDSYDAVLGLNVLHLVPHRRETIAEVARILKRGGVFVSSTACLGNSIFSSDNS